VMDARFVREAIEADIVRLLASRDVPGLAGELKDQLAEQRQVAASNPQKFMELDDRFHRTLAEAAGKASVWNVVETLKTQMDRVRFLSLSHFPVANLIAQHAAIVEGIAAGDEARAEAALRAHLREILTDLPAIAEARPGLFETAA